MDISISIRFLTIVNILNNKKKQGGYLQSIFLIGNEIVCKKNKNINKKNLTKKNF